MKKLLFLAVVLCFGINDVKAKIKNPILVELFTSQGCSSCPPADAFAGELVKRDDVIVLSLPITYWDRLGWKDSLAKPQFTQRQRLYARSFKTNRVYTPQMIIDGTRDLVGSSRNKFFRLIKKRRSEKNQNLHLDLKKNKNGLLLSIKGPTNRKKTTLWRVNFIKQKSVEIGSGENGGRVITYYNVAKSIAPIRKWQAGEKYQLSVRPDYDGVAVFIQKKNNGEVLASSSYILN